MPCVVICAQAWIWKHSLPQLVIVDLNEGGLQIVHPLLITKPGHSLQELFHCSWDDATPLLIWRPLHGEGLARPGLPIAEQAHMIAIQGRLDQLRHLCKNICLAVPRREHAVEAKGVVLAIHSQSKRSVAWQAADGAAGMRPHTAEDAYLCKRANQGGSAGAGHGQTLELISGY